MMRVGMLTSGGDCQALNATMRGVAKTLYNADPDTQIFGFEEGYRGLMYNDYILMKPNDFVQLFLLLFHALFQLCNTGIKLLLDFKALLVPCWIHVYLIHYTSFSSCGFTLPFCRFQGLCLALGSFLYSVAGISGV